MKTKITKNLGLFALLCVSGSLLAQTPTTTQNYVMKKQVFVTGAKDLGDVYLLNSGEFKANIDYFDGLGRLSQQVAHRAGANGKDVIIPHAYDFFGREGKKYLSYVGTGFSGTFQTNAVTNLTTYRNNPIDEGISDAGNYPYSKTVYDESPLNRVLKQGAPGAAWQPNSNIEDFSDHAAKYQYSSNGAGEIVLLRGENGGNVTVDGFYYPGTLRKNTSYDEDNNQVVIFTDRLDRTVLKRNIDDGVNHDTYYIYNEFGQLYGVVQPEGMNTVYSNLSSSPAALANCFVNTDNDIEYVSGEPSDDDPYKYSQGNRFIKSPGNIVYRTGTSVKLIPGFKLSASTNGSTFIKHSDDPIPVASAITIPSNYSFQYRYDGRGRLIEKKVPGGGLTSFVYDSRNRLRLSQDAKQDAEGKWVFYKYDVFDREVQQGIIDSGATRAAMQTTINNDVVLYESRDIALEFYTNNMYPNTVTSTDLHLLNIYDDYTADGGLKFNSPYTGSYLTSPIGLLTTTMSKVGTTWLSSVTYYDEKYRPIFIIGTNYMQEINSVAIEYNFAGWVLRKQTIQEASTPSITINERFTYDHMGRSLNHYHKIDSKPEVLLSSNRYNNLGELIEKNLYSTDNGSTFMQSVDYRYNVRGWLTSINNAQLTSNSINNDNDDYWGMELGYNTGLSGVSSTVKYNGNISAVKWSDNLGLSSGAVVPNVTERSYAYTYDEINRLISADQRKKTTAWANSSSNKVHNLSYDQNGNIKSLSRNSDTGADMDILTYNYGSDGNRLKSVSDAGDVTKGFVDGNSGTDYTYYANGSMKQDLNKGITDITYNFNNLPEVVTKSDGQYVKYIYDATGVKNAQEVYNSSDVLQKRTIYLGSFIYESVGAGPLELQLIQHEEGRIVPDAITGDWEYQYHIKDHLGNVRTTFTTKPKTFNFVATFESENAIDEEATFNNIAETREIFNSADAGATGNEVVKVNNIKPMGAGLSLPVTVGDKLTMEVYAYYEGGTGYNSNIAASTLIGMIAGGFGGAAGGTIEQQATYDVFSNSLGEIGFSGTDSDARPAAYINYILFDENMVYYQYGHKQITTAANFGHEEIAIEDVVVGKPGFAFVYLSNESNSLNPVYFDDMKVTLAEHPVRQKDDYYPFGLTFNSYNRVTAKKNNFKFNGMEEQTETNTYKAFFRDYDPALGRWNQIDPKAEKYYSWGSYAAMGDNPINIADPLGDEWKTKDDEKKAEQISGQLKSRENGLAKQEQRLDKRIAKADAKGKTDKVSSLTDKKSDVTQQKNDVISAQGEIAAIGADENKTFTFNQLGEGKQVGFTSTDKDGTVVINYVAGAFGNTVHELKHASQIQQGLLSPIAGTELVNFTGITPANSEVQAYQRQLSAAPGTLPPSSANGGKTPTTFNGVNGNYVRGIYYNNAAGKKVYQYSSPIYKK